MSSPGVNGISAHGLPDVSLAEKARALRTAAAYPHPVTHLEAVETHFAWIFLAGEFAYKLKKPVRIARMDHSTLEARRHSCHEELRLNRRLAPEVYLDVVALRADDHGSLLCATGKVVDWLVKMRRLDRERFLDRNLHSLSQDAAPLSAVGKLLAEFFRRQSVEEIDALAYRRRIASQVEDNLRELLSPDLDLPPALVERVIARQRRFLEQSASLLEQRAAGRRIVEGHGDLRPEHIYLGAPMCVIDCVEFDRDLRVLDPLEELAFLFLECDLSGAGWAGREILRVYAEHSGDQVPEKLFDFYVSHRAAVRAKVVAWHLRDEQYRELSDWRASACRYLRFALR